MDVVTSIQNLFLASGAGWVLWLLIVLSVISLAISVERVLYFRQKGGDLRALARRVSPELERGDFAAARKLLAASQTLGAVVATAGLEMAARGPEAADKAMQSALAGERSRLEARLAFLGTLGNNAPFVGLFGTVIGVIHAFDELGRESAAGGAASQAVMSGIAEALIATAVGIAVALPAVAANNWFQRRIANLIADADVLSNLVLAYLQERKA
jgi:biopolymer transport protein ExbB